MITKKQIKTIHTLLNRFDLMDNKVHFINQLTNGRTQSTRELTYKEAELLLDYLRDYDGSQELRRKIFSLGYQMGMIYGDTPEDLKLNAVKIDKFLKTRGTVKKPLNELTVDELKKVIRQFQAMKRYRVKSKQTKQLKALLEGTGVTI
ncbi:MAG: hypothetical protein ACPGSD_12145 [Flavobacteriales bacterium]